ncbi:MAG: efflux RND transporter periplasmic adaptor subunit [Sandaracinaceae bacterium]|nr:efflux RND transporter periplasmic adaptor subunit [Sandaracinaceae bacterium]
MVRAPIDGTVALLRVSQGDTVAPAAPLCAIVQMDRVEVELRVTEQDYVRVREGMAVTVRPPALPEVVRAGTVRRISPVLDPLTRTATVEVDVENADGTLRPGMVAHAAIELSRRSGVVLAPARALVLSSRTETEREAAIFVLDRAAGVARRVAVRLGRRYDRRVGDHRWPRGRRGGRRAGPAPPARRRAGPHLHRAAAGGGGPMTLSELSIRRGVTTAMIYLCLLGFGLFSLSRLPLNRLPEVELPVIAVVTTYVGASPEDVETLLTEPIERAVASVEAVETVQSTSRQGTSIVIISFTWGTDMSAAEVEVRKNLELFAQDFLPDEASRPLTFAFDPASRR